MRFQKPVPPNPRLTRALRWVSLWLRGTQAFLDFVCAYAPLSHQAEAIAHNWLDQIAHLVALYIVGNVARHAPERPVRIGGRPRRDIGAGFTRAVIGSALRKHLHRGDARARTARLASILRDPSALERALSRRLKRGLTRRARIAPARDADALRACCISACAIADTS